MLYCMFHYRTGKINTAPLSSAATTHFFIISYIFHFCRAASAPGSRAKKKTPTYKNLHRCYSVVKPRTDFQTGTNFPSAAKVAAQPGSALPKWGQAAAWSTQHPSHGHLCQAGKDTSKGTGRDSPRQAAPETPRSLRRLCGRNTSTCRAPAFTAIKLTLPS